MQNELNQKRVHTQIAIERSTTAVYELCSTPREALREALRYIPPTKPDNCPKKQAIARLYLLPQLEVWPVLRYSSFSCTPEEEQQTEYQSAPTVHERDCFTTPTQRALKNNSATAAVRTLMGALKITLQLRMFARPWVHHQKLHCNCTHSMHACLRNLT